MENVKENPNTSKSNLIIITPDELLKLGLFKDLQTSSVSGSVSESTQISNECVIGLKQKISNKLKAAAQYVNNKAQDKSKHKKYKTPKNKGELASLNSEIPNISGIGTSCPLPIEKEKNHTAIRKSASMLVPKSTNNESHLSKSKLKSEYKINKPTVLNSTVPSPSYTSMKNLNLEKKISIPEKKISILQKQMGMSKPMISQSAPNTSKSSTKPGKRRPEIFNLKMKPVYIGDKTISTSKNFYRYSNTDGNQLLEASGNNLNTSERISGELESQNKTIKKLIDRQNSPNTDNKREKCNLFKTVTIADQTVLTSSTTDSKISKNDQNKVKALISSKLENGSVKDIVHGTKKEVNVISNTPVCFSTEELKHLTSKVKYSPENSFQNIGVKSESGKLQIRECGIQKDAEAKIEIHKILTSEQNRIASFNTEPETLVCGKEQFPDVEKVIEVSLKTNGKKEMILSADSDDGKEKSQGNIEDEEYKSQLERDRNIPSPSKLIKVKKKDETVTKDFHNVNNKVLEKDQVPTRVNLEEPSGKDGSILFQANKKEVIEVPQKSQNSPSMEFILAKEKCIIQKSILEKNTPKEKEESNEMGTVGATFTGNLEIQDVNIENNSVGNKILGVMNNKRDIVEKRSMDKGRISESKKTGVEAVHHQMCGKEETQEKLGEASKKSKQEKQPEKEMKSKEERKSITKSGQNMNERSKRRKKSNETASQGQDMKLQTVIKTYSRKSKENIVNKDKTVVEANIPSDMQLSQSKDFPKIENEESTSGINNIKRNIQKSEEKKEETATKDAQEKRTTDLSVSKRRRRKRRLIVFDAPIPKEDNSTDSSSKIRKIVNYEKNIEIDSVACTTEKFDELENSGRVKKIQENVDSPININKSNTDNGSKKDFNTTMESKEKLHITSLQDSLRYKLLGSLRNVESFEDLSKETRKLSENVDSKDTQQVLKNDEIIRESESCDDSKKEGLNITTLHKSLTQVSIKIPKKRGRPRKMQEDSEFSMSSLKSEQTFSSTNILEACTSVNDLPEKRSRSNENVRGAQEGGSNTLSSSSIEENNDPIKNSVKEKISQTDRQLSNKQYTEEYMGIKNKNIEVEMPVLEKHESKSQLEPSTSDCLDSFVSNIDQLNTDNKTIDKNEGGEKSKCILADTLLEINQSEEETYKNVHSKDMQKDLSNLDEKGNESFQKTVKTPLISSTIEAETPTVSTPKTPRKRGRPRKNTTEPKLERLEDEADKNMEKNVENSTDDSTGDKFSAKQCLKGDVIAASFQRSFETTSNNVVEAETPVASVSETPRKRGRKRKNINIEETLEKNSTVPVAPHEEMLNNLILDESLSGRKRKRINYFEVENSIEIEDNVGNKRRRKTFPSASKLLKKTQNITTECQKKEDNFKLNSSSALDGEIQEESDLTESCGFSQGNVDEDKIEEFDTTEQRDNESDISSTNIKKPKSKSKKTGETIMMLNSIFTAAFKNKPNSQTEVEENESKKGISDESIPKALVDRRSKSAKTAYLVIDEDNMVMCMICNQKVDNENWCEHNENVHYNLAWREGESEVNMNDSAFIMKRLKPIMQKQKWVKCNNCAKKYTKIKDFIAHREVCSGIVSSTGFITCAICNTEMAKSKWSFHKQKQHNNLAWRVGDHPLNLNDQNLVLSILNALYKAKKPLHCEKCGTLKKSVIGFLSHQSQCGSENIEQAKVKCEFCDRKVLPVSMPSHIKMVHETPKKEHCTGEVSGYFDVKVDSTLPQRRAAKTALRMIDKFSKYKIVQERNMHYIAQVDFTEESFITPILQNELSDSEIIKCKFKDCEFVTDEVNILLNHMNSCEKKPVQYYVCKKCLLINDSEDEIKEHVKITHSVNLIEDDFKVEYDEESDEYADDNEDNELYQKELRRRISFEKKKSETDINYKSKPSFLFATYKKANSLFSHAFAFTMEFCFENFSQSLLFDELRNLKNDWTLLNDELTHKYLPQSEQSCSVARRTVNNFENVVGFQYTFKKFELFESDCDKGIVTIFCGGPVYSMAWLPTPHTAFDSKQVLAVAAGKCFEEKHLVNETYSEPSLIQFWDFGVLKNRGDMLAPKLMFCLAFDFGPVWHLEWCPSGCYDGSGGGKDDQILRMGLLAVAGSDSVVYIYSIPFFKDEEMGLIYQVKPLLKLQLMVGEELIKKRKFFATKISWSMTRGHRHVAVGYTDGMVGLYDMETKLKLLKFKDDDMDVLLPYKFFQAHTYYISALNWVPLSGGNRWLMTGSFDRNTFIWDLSNDSKMSVSKKIILTDGIWLTNWISFASAADESSTNCHSVHASVQPYRGYMYDHAYVMICPTTITSISSSSWLNSIIQGNTVGEITATFPHQMLYNLNSEKSWKSLRYYFGYTKLIDKNKTPEERVEEEKIAKDTVSKAIKNPSARGLAMNHVRDVDNPHYSKYEPITYREANQKYGLLFCDMKMDKFSNLPKKTRVEHLSFSKPNLYSLQKINKIVYNPNRQASLYYATGHQAGFVRLTYMKFLENDRQIV